MKRILVAITVLIATISINAQGAGNMWIGGSLGGEYTNGAGGSENKAFNIGPEFGYTLSDKIGVGLELNLGYANTTNNYSSIQMANGGYYYSLTQNKAINRNITINPFIRYSFLRVGIASLFVDGGLFYSHSNTRLTTYQYFSYHYDYGYDSEYEDYTYAPPSRLYEYRSKIITNSYGIRFRPGFAVNLSKKVSLIGKLGFLGYTHSRSDGETQNSYNLSFDMKDISVGAIVSF